MRTPSLMLAVLVGCGGNPQKQLDDAKALWVESGSEAYDMTVERSQMGPGTDSVRVSVVSGGVVSATRTTGGANAVLETSDYLPWFTVPGLFDEVQAGIDAGAFEVLVDYDSDSGYPVNITIDMEQLAADDDVTYAVTSMTLDPSG